MEFQTFKFEQILRHCITAQNFLTDKRPTRKTSLKIWANSIKMQSNSSIKLIWRPHFSSVSAFYEIRSSHSEMPFKISGEIKHWKILEQLPVLCRKIIYQKRTWKGNFGTWKRMKKWNYSFECATTTADKSSLSHNVLR